MKVSVLIPFRRDGSLRDRAFSWNVDRWRSMLPDAEIVVGRGGDPGEDFSRSRARNDAFEQSSGDVLVLADADTAVGMAETVHRAIDAVGGNAKRWVLPYSTYFNMCREDTEQLLEGDPAAELGWPTRWEHRLTDSVAGILVMPRAAYEAVGGYDEWFKGWGYEDRSMAVALDALWAPHLRLASSYVLHLWHEIPTDGAFNSPHIVGNRKRHAQYEANRRSPEALRGLRGSGT